MHRLLRNINNGAIVDWSPEKNGNTKYVELTEDEVIGYFGYSAAKSGKPVNLDPDRDGITIFTTSMGIGDAITTLYAACGLAKAGYKVTYNTRHYKWIELAYQQNLTMRPLTRNEMLSGVDVNQDYQDQLWETYIGRLKSRPHWLIRNVRKNYPTIREGIEPSRPDGVIKPDPIEEGNYIVLSPYSSVVGPSRDWPASNYAMLIHKLVKEGYRCVVPITSEHKESAHLFEMPGCKVWIDRKPEDVVRLVAHASAVVANDSGVAHLGGFLQVPTFAIMAIVSPSVTFWCTDTVQAIVPHPRIPCRFCHWQKEGGIIPSCGTFCGAIATITPDDVLTDVLFQLKNQSSIREVQKEPE